MTTGGERGKDDATQQQVTKIVSEHAREKEITSRDDCFRPFLANQMKRIFK